MDAVITLSVTLLAGINPRIRNALNAVKYYCRNLQVIKAWFLSVPEMTVNTGKKYQENSENDYSGESKNMSLNMSVNMLFGKGLWQTWNQ